MNEAWSLSSKPYGLAGCCEPSFCLGHTEKLAGRTLDTKSGREEEGGLEGEPQTPSTFKRSCHVFYTYRGRKIYEPPRYMSVNQAAQQLLEIVQNQRIRGEEPAVTEETLCVGLARVGAEDQKIAAGTLQQMCTVDLGGPLHSLIITGGSLHPLEMEMLSLFSVPENSSESQSTDGL
ncbi:Diphthine methyl ester synthase, partial [Eschrichtius robustus]|nr:Diphthine methyl ester synthase [Eschrichtius robustus]